MTCMTTKSAALVMIKVEVTESIEACRKTVIAHRRH